MMGIIGYTPLFFSLVFLLILPLHLQSPSSGRNNQTTKGMLPNEEVDALNSIISSMGIRQDQTFSNDPCTKLGPVGPDSGIVCDCSFDDNTTCHVVKLIYSSVDATGIISPQVGNLIYLKRLDLSSNMLHGSIPSNLGNLSNLEFLDLSFNFLEGSLPENLGTMPYLLTINLRYNLLEGPIPPTLGLLPSLRYLYLNVNRLKQTIPWQLGNISTLGYMSLADNLLSGTLSPELGKLRMLRFMRITGNNFFGELPASFENLTELYSFSIRGNSFHGQINFIEKWEQLQILDLIGNNFDGPLPAGLFNMNTLTQLWVTDLRVSRDSTFPQLSKLIRLKSLILRNCSIVDKIPEYIGEMKLLTDLDLSFNNLTGEIPLGLQNLNFLSLTRNNFHGSIPDWVSSVPSRNETIMMDFSYNHFSKKNYSNDSLLPEQQSTMNFFNCCTSSDLAMDPSMQILNERCPFKTIRDDHLRKNDLRSALNCFGNLSDERKISLLPHLKDHFIPKGGSKTVEAELERRKALKKAFMTSVHKSAGGRSGGSSRASERERTSASSRHEERERSGDGPRRSDKGRPLEKERAVEKERAGDNIAASPPAVGPPASLPNVAALAGKKRSFSGNLKLMERPTMPSLVPLMSVTSPETSALSRKTAARPSQKGKGVASEFRPGPFDYLDGQGQKHVVYDNDSAIDDPCVARAVNEGIVLDADARAVRSQTLLVTCSKINAALSLLNASFQQVRLVAEVGAQAEIEVRELNEKVERAKNVALVAECTVRDRDAQVAALKETVEQLKETVEQLKERATASDASAGHWQKVCQDNDAAWRAYCDHLLKAVSGSPEGEETRGGVEETLAPAQDASMGPTEQVAGAIVEVDASGDQSAQH